MSVERRFKGAMSEEYKLIRLALPHFEELQGYVAEAVVDYPCAAPSSVVARPRQSSAIGAQLKTAGADLLVQGSVADQDAAGAVKSYSAVGFQPTHCP